jgi:hypothetical protein
MDLDPMESVDKAKGEEKKSRLNAMVAVTIALLATFLGLCKVKDDNICQSMQQDQANSIDAWSTYHAKSTDAKILNGNAVSLEIQSESVTGPIKDKALAAAKEAHDAAAKELKDKDEWQKKAKDATDDYGNLNYRDDQFDLSDTLCALAISLLAITSLTQKTFLYWFSLVPTALGILMGIAGLFSLKIHPDAITNLLSVIGSLSGMGF